MFRTAGMRLVRSAMTLGSLLGTRRKRQSRGGRVVRAWREDSDHHYPSVGLTPTRLMNFLRSADAGWPQLQFELFHEMLQKWPRLAAVEATRRLALTGLEWEILPEEGGAADAEARRLARQAAEYCGDVLRGLASWRTALNHLALGIGYGVAAAELVWERSRLVDVTPVPYSRLIADPHAPWRLRVRTEEDPALGVALDAQPAKWVVHAPQASAGRHFEGGLLRASALLFLAQNLSFKDWLMFSQVAGMPVRVARFEPGTPEADKRSLLRMLESLGRDAVAVFSKGVDLQLIEGQRSSDAPYQPLQQYCNSEVTILWLGQHLTTELQAHGSRAAAEIHDRVREDLLVNDMAEEAETIRRDVLTPLVRARFGDGVAAPHFRRSLIQSVDTRVLADTLAVAVRELGMRVPRRWVHRALGVPEPNGDEPVLEGRRER